MRRRSLLTIHCVLLLASTTWAEDFNRTILPIPDQPFEGQIGLRPADSTKDFPKPVAPPEGAPGHWAAIRLLLSWTNSPSRAGLRLRLKPSSSVSAAVSHSTYMAGPSGTA